MDAPISVTSRNLWRNRDFLKLWAGQTISQIGSQVSFLAIPLIAIMTLQTGAFEMGILTAIGSLPALLFGLHAGAVVDRRAHRPVMIATDLARALLLLLLPIAWWLDRLSVELLIVVAFAIGVCGLLFDLAYQAFLPLIVAREQLITGNARLELSRTAAEIAGPGIAGVLIQLVTAPVALLLDALSYLGSGLFVASIRQAEPARLEHDPRKRLTSEIRDGLRFVVRDPLLRASAGGTILLGLFNAMLEAVGLLYIVHELGINPGLIGLIFGVGGCGFVVGALLPERVAGSIGVGAATALGVAIVGLSDLLIPFAEETQRIAIPIVMIAQFAFGIGITLFRVNQTSLRQSIIPAHFRGRAASVVHVFTGGAVLTGALIGGVLGGAIGLRETLVLAAIGEIVVALWIWRSPLHHVHSLDLARSTS